jgi:hypothetical protein
MSWRSAVRWVYTGYWRLAAASTCLLFAIIAAAHFLGLFPSDLSPLVTLAILFGLSAVWGMIMSAFVRWHMKRVIGGMR